MRGSALFIGILMCSTAAFGQATVEGALTHALSTATGTAVGKAMGNVTNQMANRVTGQLGQQTSPAAPKSKIHTVKLGAQNAAAPPSSGNTEPTSTGSFIASIQGAAPQPACDSSVGSFKDKKTDDTQKSATCPSATDSHPSEITLPAPQ